MQLKLDQDGFIDEVLVDDVRAGLSTAGTALGPINKRTLKRNRQQFRDLTASFCQANGVGECPTNERSDFG